jgi:hypothetical protein
MRGPAYWLCWTLENHGRAELARRVGNARFQYLIRPLRRLKFAVLRRLRPEERSVLSGAWEPSEKTRAYLQGRFGHDEWTAVRGGMTGTLTGFMPVKADKEGRKLILVKEIVFDPMALRGRRSFDLLRLTEKAS